MKAVILAAGVGRRLYPLTRDLPKCLLRLEDTTILEYQLALLRRAGLRKSDIAIVTGYRDDLVRRAAGDGHAFIYNERYATTNNIVSLLAAREWASTAEQILVLNADTVFCWQILERLICCYSENGVIVDNVKVLGDEEMKVLIHDGLITGFGKHFDPASADGEQIGLLKLGGIGKDLLFTTLGGLVADGKTGDWYEAALDRLTNDVSFYPVYTDGLPWIEIDTLIDYQEAKGLYPRITARDRQLV